MTNGKIYAQLYTDQEDVLEWAVLDLKGNLLKKVTVPKKYPNVIASDNYYYLLQNEKNKKWELHVIEI